MHIQAMPPCWPRSLLPGFRPGRECAGYGTGDPCRPAHSCSGSRPPCNLLNRHCAHFTAARKGLPVLGSRAVTHVGRISRLPGQPSEDRSAGRQRPVRGLPRAVGAVAVPRLPEQPDERPQGFGEGLRPDAPARLAERISRALEDVPRRSLRSRAVDRHGQGAARGARWARAVGPGPEPARGRRPRAQHHPRACPPQPDRVTRRVRLFGRARSVDTELDVGPDRGHRLDVPFDGGGRPGPVAQMLEPRLFVALPRRQPGAFAALVLATSLREYGEGPCFSEPPEAAIHSVTGTLTNPPLY